MGYTWNVTESGIAFTKSVMNSLNRIARAVEKLAGEDVDEIGIVLRVLHKKQEEGYTQIEYLIHDLERQRDEATRSNLSQD